MILLSILYNSYFNNLEKLRKKTVFNVSLKINVVITAESIDKHLFLFILTVVCMTVYLLFSILRFSEKVLVFI